MKATVTYDLSDELDKLAYDDSYYARRAMDALAETRDYLRSQWKHRDLGVVSGDVLIDEIWERFHEIAGFVLEAME